MRCTSPVFVQDKHTGGILHVPCGRCIACRITRARTWSVRIMHEAKQHAENIFVTLTYNDEHLPKNLSLSKSDVQLFIKRLRKIYDFRYFIGAEYGDVGRRPHYHGVFFGLGVSARSSIEQTWRKGFVHIGSVTHDSACYCASYTLKKLSGERAGFYAKHGLTPEFSLMSRRPGIGSAFVKENESFLRNNAFCVVKGSKVALPRYYADRVFKGPDKSLLQALRGEFHAMQHDELMQKSGAEFPYQVIDYQKGQRVQVKNDLEARQNLKRRKL